LTLCFVCWAAVVAGQAGNPTRTSQWIADAYRKKEAGAAKIPVPKAVIVAGSNALFGIDSGRLSDALGMPVVNDGVNAGIELPCILFRAQKVIGEGDLVLLPLEYPMYSYRGRPGVQMIDYLFARAPHCFWKLTREEQAYMLWHITPQRVWEGYGGYRETPVTRGLYGAHHIDNRGDQNGTSAAERTEAMWQEVQRHTTRPERYGSDFDADAPGWRYLAEFVSWCRARRARVVFMPSTLLYDAYYRNDPKEKWFYMHLADEVRQRGWQFVGEPYDYMYDPAYYFNTNFHLTAEGRERRTVQMIKDLTAAGVILDMSSPVPIVPK